MINDFKNKELLHFVIRLLFLLIAWMVIDSYNWLNSSGLNDVIVYNLLHSSNVLLSFSGFDMFVIQDVVGIIGSSGVQIAAPCNGLDIMALFAAIIVAMPGKVMLKLVYISVGLLVIHLLNLIRVILLIIMARYLPEFLEFNHNYTFTLIMYVVIFIFWMIWIRKFAAIQPID